MRQRNASEPSLEDITKAFIELKIIFPAKKVDPFDVDPSTDIGLKQFEKWFNSDVNTKMRKVARPDSKSLEARRETRRKMNGVNYRMHDLAKMLDQQNKEAQMMNPTLPYSKTGDSSATTGDIGTNAGVNGDEMQFSNNVVDGDWIQFLLRDQITDQVMTQKLKIRANDSLSEQKPTVFKGTVFADYIPKDLQQYVQGDLKPNSDFIIKGPLPEKLMHAFPYYKSEDEDDEEDENEENQNDEMEIDNSNENTGEDPRFEGFEYFEHDVSFNDASGGANGDLDLFS